MTAFLTPELSDFRCDLDAGMTQLSALRLWEHGVLGQVNVTGSPISPRFWESQVLRHIDVVQCVDGIETIICTLQDFCDSDASATTAEGKLEIVLPNPCKLLSGGRWKTHPRVVALRRTVERYLYHLSHRVAGRGIYPTFWPVPYDAKYEVSTLGIPGLYSKLIRFLTEKGVGRHKVPVWLEMLSSGQRQGFRQEELIRSRLEIWLKRQEVDQPDRRFSVAELIKNASWSDIRLSVIPVLQYSATPITLQPQANGQDSSRKIVPVRDKTKPQIGQRRFIHEYDPVLGYRVEGIEHQTLWGTEVHWQAVTHSGQPIRNQYGAHLLSKSEVAHDLAVHHAQRMLPKMEQREVWRKYTLAGGENYREWLVTLPWHPITHEENHFDVRNVLIHIRCDERCDAQGNKLLFLHEVQSDWAQKWAQAQREQESDPSVTNTIPQPPFCKEWPLLAVKLMLLHAVAWNFQGMAWMRGDMQEERFGDGYSWFKTLYDEIIPKSVRQAVSCHGGCVTQLIVHDGSHVQSVMGVLLDQNIKSSLVRSGLPAWG